MKNKIFVNLKFLQKKIESNLKTMFDKNFFNKKLKICFFYDFWNLVSKKHFQATVRTIKLWDKKTTRAENFRMRYT